MDSNTSEASQCLLCQVNETPPMDATRRSTASPSVRKLLEDTPQFAREESTLSLSPHTVNETFAKLGLPMGWQWQTHKIKNGSHVLPGSPCCSHPGEQLVPEAVHFSDDGCFHVPLHQWIQTPRKPASACSVR